MNHGCGLHLFLSGLQSLLLAILTLWVLDYFFTASLCLLNRLQLIWPASSGPCSSQKLLTAFIFDLSHLPLSQPTPSLCSGHLSVLLTISPPRPPQQLFLFCRSTTWFSRDGPHDRLLFSPLLFLQSLRAGCPLTTKASIPVGPRNFQNGGLFSSLPP